MLFPKLLTASGLFAGGVAAILLGYHVHRALNVICIMYARAFCRRGRLDVRRWRAGPEFQSGVKTEFTIVELDCLDYQRRRRLIRLVVWIFGIRKVLNNEAYPDSYDEQWPQIKT